MEQVRNILLLTSTIRPNPNQPQLKIIDPAERLEDYKKALRFFCEELNQRHIDKIVFIDNSGVDLNCLSAEFPSSDIEWISFYGLDYPSEYHRGYGEFRMVDYAMTNSKTLSQLDAEYRIWKVTGRYIVKNLRSFIRFSPSRFELYCDVKNNWAEMGVIAWNRIGYEAYIRDAYKKFATAMAPELILADLIKNTLDRKGVVTRFYWMPLQIGRRGADGSAFVGRFTLYKFYGCSVINFCLLPIRRFLNNVIH